VEANESGVTRNTNKNLFIVLAVLFLLGLIGYFVARRVGDSVDSIVGTEEVVKDEYENIQEEIKEVQRLNMAGEITDEEAQQRLQELSEKSLQILKESR
jgi:Na+-transporting methylmalonyl-CoA/oxaloacetate decarboxylase gamma subunit